MAEKSILEQIIEEFIERISQHEILEKEKLDNLKDVLNSDKHKKADIIKAIRETD